MKRFALVLPLLLIGKLPSCKVSCAQLEDAVRLACATDQGSVACVEAKQKLSLDYPNGCAPSPTPTPEPTPTPTPEPTPTPPVLGPVIDFSILEYDPASGGPALRVWDAIVEAAEIAVHPQHCDSGRCVIPWPIDQWHAAVCEQVRVREMACGWQPDADQISVGFDAKPGSKVQGFKVYAGDEAGGGVMVRSDSAKWHGDSWTLRLKSGPVPTPPPPGPTPVPSPDACGQPDPTSEHWALPCIEGGHFNSHIHTMGRYDTTWVCDVAYHDPADKGRAHDWCVAIGMGEIGGTPRSMCPVRPDGHPQRVACEYKVFGGPPTWQGDGNLDINPDNPAQAGCEGCTYLKVCWADGSHCKDVLK